MAIADEFDATIGEIALADTMGWSTPVLTMRVVSEVRSRWPDIPVRLHLHDTRGLGIAGNIATEELVLLAEESGVSTGIDIDAMIEAGHLAENIIGRTLPSAVLRGGSLDRFRSSARANHV